MSRKLPEAPLNVLLLRSFQMDQETSSVATSSIGLESDVSRLLSVATTRSMCLHITLFIIEKLHVFIVGSNRYTPRVSNIRG